MGATYMGRAHAMRARARPRYTRANMTGTKNPARGRVMVGYGARYLISISAKPNSRALATIAPIMAVIHSL